MNASDPPVALVLTGPTASGKSALAIDVARLLSGEIVSMDSRQVYRGMDIGTAKATASQRSLVVHHGLDLVEPDERFSAGKFARLTRELVAEIRERGRVPLLVGGSGFFLRALTAPIFREPVMEPERRSRLQRLLESFSAEELARWVAVLDPDLAGRFARGGGGVGRQRLLRALELPLMTGRPLSWWQRHGPAEADPLPVLVIVLNPPRDRLYEAIDRRVDAMLAAGLLEEVEALQERGYGAGDPGMNATGYAELLPVLAGRQPLEEAAERIRRNTRSYARRQLTWLRHQLPPGSIWIDPAEEGPPVADRVVAEWRKAVAGGEQGECRPAPEEQPRTERRDAE